MITLKLLKELGTCQEGIRFFQNNKLEGYPLNRLNEIKGDHKGYVGWLKYELNPGIIRKHDDNGNLIYKKYSYGNEFWYEYDENNNLIHYKTSSGFEEWYKIEYYEDGQLKKYDYLEIPWFTKSNEYIDKKIINKELKIGDIYYYIPLNPFSDEIKVKISDIKENKNNEKWVKYFYLNKNDKEMGNFCTKSLENFLFMFKYKR